jgi:hypothetical protein
MMTYEDAVSWLTQYRDVSCVSAKTLDGASSADEATDVGTDSFWKIALGGNILRMVVGSPAPGLEVVVPFMVGWYVEAFGHPTPAQLARAALLRPS